MTYESVKQKIDSEASLPPGKRTQAVPCAFCVRGGNGGRDCACGMNERKYSKFKGCFAGTLLDTNPNGGKK